MSNSGGILRLLSVSLICSLILSYTAYRFLFTPEVGAAGSEFLPVSEFVELEKTVEPVTEGTENTTPPTQTESTAVAASAGAVLGGISERFISPYTAKASYNGVYLKNSTDLAVDIKTLLEAPLGYKIEKNGQPQVLIIHTHTTESFMTEERDYYTDADASRSNDEGVNMIALGSIVAEILNENGITTLHDKTVHDYPEYNGSYSRAAKTITSNLKKHPSIKIVIDLHRDAIAAQNSDKVKLTTEIEGKKAAQIMLVMGSQSGSVTNFPNWQENLKLAVRLQQTIEGMYPSLARSLSLMPKNYNESLTTGSMLIEIGTDANTVEEVKYSAQLLGNALKALLNTL